MKFSLSVVSLILICSASFSQAINDDCVTATDLGALPLAWNEMCADNTNDYSISIMDSNTLATPSIPFYSMSGCTGYSPTTTVSGDDVWFKYRNQVSVIQLRVPTSDTAHLNLYYGTNCNSLQPVGCWTRTNGSFAFDDFYSSNDTINEFNYIQVSGISPGRKISFALCIRSWGMSSVPAYGTININTSFNINLLKKNISPNPFISGIKLENFEMGELIEIFDIYGTIVCSKTINTEIEQLNLEHLRNGIYLIRYNQSNSFAIYKMIKTN